jgi:ATP-dependent protease ClpP protease subunit
MALPPTIYASLGGLINPDSLSRIFNNLAGATAGGAISIHLLLQSMGGTVGDGISLYDFFHYCPVNIRTNSIGYHP